MESYPRFSSYLLSLESWTFHPRQPRQPRHSLSQLPLGSRPSIEPRLTGPPLLARLTGPPLLARLTLLSWGPWGQLDSLQPGSQVGFQGIQLEQHNSLLKV